MSYSTIMVHLDGARSNTAVLETTAALAARHHAKVIGIAACEPVQIGSCGGYLDGSLAVVERDIVVDQLSRTNNECHAHHGLAPHLVEWRSIETLDTIADVIASHAGCADLLVVGSGSKPGGSCTHADIRDLVLRAGRPVLVVPEANVTSDFRMVIVACAETPECRRAVADALPVLHRATGVILVAAHADMSAMPTRMPAYVNDIMAWLGRHGIRADTIIARAKGSGPSTLTSIADEARADLIVAGAYCHGRLHDWAFGGTTHDLLLHERHCTLLSH